MLLYGNNMVVHRTLQHGCAIPRYRASVVMFPAVTAVTCHRQQSIQDSVIRFLCPCTAMAAHVIILRQFLCGRTLVTRVWCHFACATEGPCLPHS